MHLKSLQVTANNQIIIVLEVVIAFEEAGHGVAVSRNNFVVKKGKMSILSLLVCL